MAKKKNNHNRSEAHQKLMDDCIKAGQPALKDARFYPRTVGSFKTFNGNYIKIGVPGQADCFMYHKGRAYEIEFKSGNAVQNPEQKIWQNICETLEVVYVVIHSVDEMKAFCSRVNLGKKT